ncbi:MAG: cupin domain-containing protein, partial [Acutalibacteraceae bacterium]
MLPFHDVVPFLEASRVVDARDFRFNHWTRSMDYPAHLHAQVEMIYLLEGSLEVLIDDESRVMQAGDFAVAFPNHIHAYRAVDGVSADANILFFIFFPQLVPDFESDIRDKTPASPFVTSADMPSEAVLALKRLALPEVRAREITTRAYLQIVLDGVRDLLSLQKPTGRRRDLAYQALRYMTDHFRQPLTVQQVAQELGVNKNYLSGLFTKRLHM